MHIVSIFSALGQIINVQSVVLHCVYHIFHELTMTEIILHMKKFDKDEHLNTPTIDQ